MAFLRALFKKKPAEVESATSDTPVRVLLIGKNREQCLAFFKTDDRSAEFEALDLKLSNIIPRLLRGTVDVLLLCPVDLDEFGKLNSMAAKEKNQCAIAVASKDGVIIGRAEKYVSLKDGPRRALERLITMGRAERAQQQQLCVDARSLGYGGL